MFYCRVHVQLVERCWGRVGVGVGEGRGGGKEGRGGAKRTDSHVLHSLHH